MAATGRRARAPAAEARRPRLAGGRAGAAKPERPLTLVVDASALIDAVLGRGLAEWSRLLTSLDRTGDDLAGPELLWSESYSVLHELAWRRQLEPDEVDEARKLIADAPIAVRRPRNLRERAWSVADRMGWAKTYDAEYCALAEILRCELVTTDRRLRAAGQRLGYVVTVAEVAARQ